jgi:hypothetical protein
VAFKPPVAMCAQVQQREPSTESTIQTKFEPSQKTVETNPRPTGRSKPTCRPASAFLTTPSSGSAGQVPRYSRRAVDDVALQFRVNLDNQESGPAPLAEHRANRHSPMPMHNAVVGWLLSRPSQCAPKLNKENPAPNQSSKPSENLRKEPWKANPSQPTDPSPRAVRRPRS